MDIRIDHLHIEHFHAAESSPNGVAAQLDQLLSLLQTQGRDMSAALARLTQEVAETKTVAASAVALLNGIGAQLREIKDDPAAIEELANQLDATQSDLASAIAANTVASSEPASPPEPETPATPVE